MNLKDLHLVENFSQGDKTATIRINKPITNNPATGITGNAFSAEFDFLVRNGVEKVLIPINSTGGNVFSGMEIYSTISDATIDTETRVVGVAASMAGIISQAGKKRTIKEHALFHAHAPRAEEGKSVSAEILNMSYNSIKSLLKGTSGISEDKANEILGKESFFEAQNAAELGFFDEVIPSGAKMPHINNSMKAEEIMEIFNNLGKKSDKMKKVNILLDLEAEANENSVVASVTKLKADASKVKGLEASIETKDAEIATLKNQITEANKAKAVSLVENAIKDGKISEDQKELWIENAQTNFESAEAMIGGIKGVVSAKSESITNAIATDEVENRKDWDFKQWGKEDPQGLENMRINDSTNFEKLLNEYTD